jgi:hypothetical protein
VARIPRHREINMHGEAGHLAEADAGRRQTIAPMLNNAQVAGLLTDGMLKSPFLPSLTSTLRSATGLRPSRRQ